MSTWNNAGDGREYLETSDPRVVAVIERDPDMSSTAPDGDAYAPAYWLEYGRGGGYHAESAGFTFSDDDAANTYANALGLLGSDVAARYMRIFHDTRVMELDTRDSRLVLLSTPAFRAHVGIENADGTRALNGAGRPIADEVAYSLDGDAQTWRHYLDGEVYGIGYAVLPERTTDETPIPDDLEGWEVEMTCWGFYGVEYARECAAGFEYDSPQLPEMLPIPA